MTNDQQKSRNSNNQNILEFRKLGFGWDLGFGHWDLK